MNKEVNFITKLFCNKVIDLANDISIHLVCTYPGLIDLGELIE